MGNFADDFGQVAATYLARDHHPERLNTVSALIRGIRDPELIRQLCEAEMAIGPRKEVIAELNQQKFFLDEFPELTLPVEELPRRDSRDIPTKEVVFENATDREGSASARVERMRADGGKKA